MQTVSSDSAKVLTEKLSLARELSTLKPELEYLRGQVTAQQGLLTEKLSLQRELATLRVELENEKHAIQRLKTKENKSSATNDSTSVEIEELKKALAKERRDKENAEQVAEQAQEQLEEEKRAARRANARKTKNAKDDEDREAELDSIREELAKEKRDKKKAELQARQLQDELDLERSTVKQIASNSAKNHKSQYDGEIKSLEAQLAEERDRRFKAEASAKQAVSDLEAERKPNKATRTDTARDAPKLEELQKELSEEQRNRQLVEKQYVRSQKEWEGQRAVLDDKLNQFRNKLRTTKEKLKETETQLEKAQEAASFNTKPGPAGRFSRKRTATADPDMTTLGTPGDVHATKKARRAQNIAAGEKSTFSITPFLNRTASIAPENSESGKEEEALHDAEAATESTPSAPPRKTIPNKAPVEKIQPLTTATAGKSNPKAPPARKKSSFAPLDKVIEEGNEENDAVISESKEAEQSAHATKEVPKLKNTTLQPKKPRKSLANFASFAADAEPEKKKKRKLGGGAFSKTIFDEEEGTAAPTKPIPGKGLFGGVKALSKGTTKGPPAIKYGFGIRTDDGFTFSPLKKDRKAAREASTFIS
jgi:hypothetical protein